MRSSTTATSNSCSLPFHNDMAVHGHVHVVVVFTCAVLRLSRTLTLLTPIRWCVVKRLKQVCETLQVDIGMARMELVCVFSGRQRSWLILWYCGRWLRISDRIVSRPTSVYISHGNHFGVAAVPILIRRPVKYHLGIGLTTVDHPYDTQNSSTIHDPEYHYHT